MRNYDSGRHDRSRRAFFEALEPRYLLTAGALDLSFGFGAGFVVTDFGGSNDGSAQESGGMLVEPSGNIVSAGTTDANGGNFDFALARYLPSGALDTSFGGTGKVTTDFTGGNDFAPHLARQADGKLIAAGRREAPGNTNLRDVALARYNANGTLDTTFGTSGRVVHNFHPGIDQANGVALQSDGKIVVGVLEGFSGQANYFKVARFNTDGTLDTTFGTGGSATIDINPGIDHQENIAVQPDGKIVVVGRSVSAGNFLAIARFTAEGQVDTGFSGDGKLTVSAGSNHNAEAVRIDAAGNVVVAGHSESNQGLLVRVDTNGNLDATFGGGDGIVTQTFAGVTVFRDLALQTDGKLVVISEHNSDFIIARFNTDGTLDAGFGTGGSTVTSLVPGSEQASSVAIQPDGNIVVAGSLQSSPFNRDCFVARYESGAIPNTAPSVASLSLNPMMIFENDSVTLDGTFTDPDSGNEHTVTIDWGDGTIQIETLTIGNRSFSFSHQYLDDNPTNTTQDDYAIGVKVADDAGGDSSNGQWNAGQALNQPRSFHTATLLADGRLLVAGGGTTTGSRTTSELYDPSAGTWTPTSGSLNRPRHSSTAVRLQDGRVLVSGGRNGNNADQFTAEIFNPATGQWTLTGNMINSRVLHSLTLLNDGRVLAVGGYSDNSNAFLNTAETWNPSTGLWTAVPSLATGGRWQHGATLLPDGRVFIVGGENYGAPMSAWNTAEIFNPATNTWSTAASMSTRRAGAGTVLLSDGTVLVAGGFNNAGPGGSELATVELYNPATNTWTPRASMTRTRSGTGPAKAVLLNDGRVMIADGYDPYPQATASVEVYDPISNAWTLIDSLNQARILHTLTVLNEGQVIAVGGQAGFNSSTAFASTELWNAVSTTVVTVKNAAPSYNAGANETLPLGSGAFSRTGIAFTDPGVLDVHTITVDYDGDAIIDETINVPLGDRTFDLNHTYTASGVYTVSVTVEDDDIGKQADSFEVTVILNQPPEADADGPYIRNEGEFFQLDASASSDPNEPNSDLTFEWDLDFDGFTFDVDVTGEQPTVVLADNFAPRTIAVRVTDSGGLFDIATTTLEILNVASDITGGGHDAEDCGNVAAGDAVTVSVDFRDPGFDDPARGTMETFNTSTIDWGDGTIETLSISKSNGSPGVFTTGTASGTHTYQDGGIYIITVTLRDDDGGVAQFDTTAFVSGVAPPEAHAGTLYIIGTPGRDQVSVNKQGNGLLKVHANFLPSGNFRTFNLSAVNKIIAYLCEGDDHLTIAGNIIIPAIIHGGGGDDHLNAGGGPTVLLGDAGNDMLVGGGGRDLIIGGLGQDRLVGGNSDDVLIGGSTTDDDDDTALMALLAAWTSADDYADRVNAIDLLLSVEDDEEEDVLTGSSGRDLFYDGLGDTLTDRKTKKDAETVR